MSQSSLGSTIVDQTASGTGSVLEVPSKKTKDLEQGLHTPRETGESKSYGDIATYEKWPRGWRPWLNLFACWILMSSSWGQVNTYGTFASYYSQHLFQGQDLLLLNLIGGTQSLAILLLSTPVGRLLDAGHAKSLVIIGTILTFAGNLPVAFVNGQGQGEGNYILTWLFQGLLAGLGMSCFFVTSSQVAATWFPNCKPIAIGIVSTGASICGLIYPMMVKFMITEHGFRIAMVVYAVVVGGATAVASAILFIKNPHQICRKPKRWADPAVWVDTQAFRNPAFCWLTAGVCWMFFGFYAVFFNLEDWAASSGFAYKEPAGLDIQLPQEVPNDAIRTFWLLCALNGFSTIGRVSSSFLAQRFGALTIHFISTLLGAIVLFAVWIPSNTLGPGITFVVLYGALSGAIIGLPPASISYVLTTAESGDSKNGQQAQLGQWTGMMYSLSAPFALAGPIVAGHLISHYGTYLAVQLWSGICISLAAVCFFVARRYTGTLNVGGKEKGIYNTSRRATWVNEHGTGAMGASRQFLVKMLAFR